MTYLKIGHLGTTLKREGTMLEENLTSKYFYSLEINSVFNNKGFGDSTSKGSFTVVGSYYPIEHRPPDNFTYKEVPYKFKGIGDRKSVV